MSFLDKFFKKKQVVQLNDDLNHLKLSDDLIKNLNHRLQKYSKDQIINHWHEEVGELMQALNKHRRGKENALENLHEEIGDVLVLTLSLRYLFDVNEIDNAMHNKIKDKILKHKL